VAPDHRVEPVYADATLHRYARRFTLDMLHISDPDLADDVIDVGPQDVFVGLDFDAASVTRNLDTFRRWRARGTKLCFVVYDILPVTHPHVFPPGTAEMHEKWLLAITDVADGLVCIARSVAAELQGWIDQRAPPGRRPAISWFHLGADLRPPDAPASASPILKTLRRRSTRWSCFGQRASTPIS
jgi:hypothetical protein